MDPKVQNNQLVNGVVGTKDFVPDKTETKKSPTNVNSSQSSLEIAEIRDGVVIMNDGSFRSVIMAKSINFDLMSQEEQEAIEYSYQSFLNSLYFPVQISVRSRQIDLRPYIDGIEKLRQGQENMLLAMLMEDYIEYIGLIGEQANIMDKSMYVVIPFFPVDPLNGALTQSKSFFTGLGKLFSKTTAKIVVNDDTLQKAKTELRKRVQAAMSGLQQCGVQGLPLDTQELIELYYDSYNPDTATRQHLPDFHNVTADIVTKGSGQSPIKPQGMAT